MSMWTLENAVFNMKPNFEKLIQYGFTNEDGRYISSFDIMDNSLIFNVCVTQSGFTKLKVIDKATKEEYTLVKNSDAVGSFVGGVRLECEDIFNDIIKRCYEPDIFKSEYARLIIEYIRDKYNIQAEYLWEKLPNNAVFREEKTQKWFAGLLTVEKQKLGIDEVGTMEVIDIKESPENIRELIDGKNYLFGYHMNKKHWYTICLDGRVPIEEIFKRIDVSFNMLLKKKK